MDLLPFGLRGATMVVLCLHESAGLVRRPYVGESVVTPEFQRANFLHNPALAHPVNLALTQHAHTACLLPDLKPPMWGQLPTGYRPELLDLDEDHQSPPSKSEGRAECALPCSFKQPS